jgi:hypothetical protein
MYDPPFPVCEVLNGGVQATVQDLGRSGYATIGVPQAGAMDRFAFTSANLALGNSPNAAAIEILLGGFTLRFLVSTQIAIAGADLGPVLDDVALANWHTSTVSGGAQLHFGVRINGARAYLAIAGGLAVAPVLRSRSTYLGADGVASRDGRYVPETCWRVFPQHTWHMHCRSRPSTGLPTADFQPYAVSSALTTTPLIGRLTMRSSMGYTVSVLPATAWGIALMVLKLQPPSRHLHLLA